MKISELAKLKDGKFDKDAQVTLSKRKGSIRLRISHNYKDYSLTIKGGLSQASLDAAYALAQTINGDLAFQRFDTTLKKYDPDRETRANILNQSKEPNLKEIWGYYKESKKHKSAATTQKYEWREVDRLLDALPSKQLKLSELETLGQAALKLRSLTTTHRNFQLLNAAITLYTGKETRLKAQLPPEPEPPIEWFEPREVQFILQSFKDNRFCSNKSAYIHSFYYPYVSFLASTGCRPEEALALTWGDLIWSSDRQKYQVRIDKAYSKGILLPHTKNYKIRIITLSSFFVDILLTTHRPSSDPNKLIFPGYKGGYLNHNNFNRRQWKIVLEGLVLEGLVRKRLRPYCLRHSFVTNMHILHLVSLVEIAGLIGDEVKTVIQRYTGVKRIAEANIPDLYKTL